MISKGIRFTLFLAVISLLLVSGYGTTCPSGCYCARTVWASVFGVNQYRRHDASCRFSTSRPFSGGITELFYNKTLSSSSYTENLFAFEGLLMPVWRKSDSEVIAALANVHASSIVIELISTRTTIIANGALEPLANFNVKILRLVDLPITILPNNNFVPLDKLERIRVANFASGTLEGNFFHSLPGLKSLEVSGSEAFVSKDILNGDHRLHSLQDLDLRSNNLAVIPEFVFSRMTNLQSLHFENNILEDLQQFLFSPATTLKIVHFENNKLKTLPQILFSPATQLQHVHFENNILETLPEFVLSPLTSLHSIHLENNQLSEFKIDLCSFLFNRTSTHSIVNIYLENNFICNFDYVIDSFSNCVLPPNNVVYLEIRAASNYYCNTIPVYISLASGHSLIISILSTNSGVTCKSIPATTPPQCSTPNSTSVTSEVTTTSSTQSSTTKSTSVTSEETTTSSTTPIATTMSTRVTSEETTKSSTTPITTAMSTRVTSEGSTTSPTQSSTTESTSVTSEETTTSPTQSSTTESTSVTSTEATTSTTHTSVIGSKNVTSGETSTTPQNTTVMGTRNLTESDPPRPTTLGSSALVGLVLASVAVVAAVVVGIVCGVRRCSGANSRNTKSLTLKEAQYYLDLQQDAITRPQSGYITAPTVHEVDMVPPGAPPIPLRDATSAEAVNYDDATSAPRNDYYECVT